MTAKTGTRERGPRRTGNAKRTAGRYALALAVIVVVGLHSVLLGVLGILVLLGVTGYRLRRAHRRWRSGGKSAAKRRAKYQGHATLAEIRRNLSHDRGVLIGTVRSTR